VAVQTHASADLSSPRSNDHFREAVQQREAEDTSVLGERMKRGLDKGERSHVGVSQLRSFLEHLLQRRYLESVPAIVPVLEKEFRNADVRLKAVREELDDLNNSNLKAREGAWLGCAQAGMLRARPCFQCTDYHGCSPSTHPPPKQDQGRAFVESFIGKLTQLLKGTTAAPAERFGETLHDEHIRGGAFVSASEKAPAVGTEDLTNANMRLYGGAQYNRAMSEFRSVVGKARCPDIDREEIVNACGVDDFHDGANVIRTACVIGMAKARETFEPFLNQLGYRLAHILRRMLPISMYLQQKDGERLRGWGQGLERRVVERWERSVGYSEREGSERTAVAPRCCDGLRRQR